MDTNGAPEALDTSAEPSQPEALDMGSDEPTSTGDDEMDDEELLQQALALSMNDTQPDRGTATVAPAAADTNTTGIDDDGMDEEMRLALQMSMQMETEQAPTTPVSEPVSSPAPASEATTAAAAVELPTSTPAPAATAQAPAAATYDSSFVNNLLASLPGVDPSDPRIMAALQQIQAKQDEQEGKDKDSK